VGITFWVEGLIGKTPAKICDYAGIRRIDLHRASQPRLKQHTQPNIHFALDEKECSFPTCSPTRHLIPLKKADRNDRMKAAPALSGKVRISMNLVRAIADRIFGYDIFVSSSCKDGMTYAHKLEKDPLRSGLRCFLDSEEMPPGESLQLSLRGALRRSSALVLVASPGALQSPYIPGVRLLYGCPQASAHPRSRGTVNKPRNVARMRRVW